MKYTKKYFKSINSGLNLSKFHHKNVEISCEVFFEKIDKIINKVKNNNGVIYFFGNGASSAFANHMALDFSKNGGLLSRSLSDSALLTALSNDYSYEDAMFEFLKINKVSTNDLIISISSSGNSSNIVNLLDFCKKNNLETLVFSGLKPNNKSKRLGLYSIYVPMKTYGIVECCHQVFLHMILDKFMKIKEWERDSYQNMDSENLNF